MAHRLQPGASATGSVSAAAMAAATATVGPAPSDVNSPQYAQWYSRWMEVYSSYSPIMPAPSSVPTALPAASVSAQQSPGRPPITKMQAAMALLKERSAGVTSSTTNTAAAEMYAKASQFKPQSKTKPAFIPVVSKAFDDKPSYAAMAAASNPVPNANAPNAKKTPAPKPAASTGHPESLKRYISKVFSLCTPENRGAVEKHLKIMIETVKNKGALFTTDWDKMLLPGVLGGTDSMVAPSSSTTSTTTAPALAPQPSTFSPINSKKRKKFSIDLLEDRGNVPQPSSPTSALLKPKHPKPNSTTATTIPPAAASSESTPAGSPSLEFLPAHMRDAELQRREDRARRFQSAGQAQVDAERERARDRARAAAAMAAAARLGEENRDVIDWDEYTIVGVCKKLEKSYLRLTSAPDPSTVRPLAVLRKTLDLLGAKWKQDQNYTYICDQFKSLRQDLTVQRIKNDFTVRVYESHARIALEKSDVGEYNQCQAQLRELYRLGLPGCKDEFLGYRILYMVYTMNRTDQVKILSELTPAEKQSPGVKHALRVRMAVATGDYHTLFRLYNAAPFMSAYLMDLFVLRERVKALKTLCRAFRPSLAVAYLARVLGWGEEEGAVVECFDFLRGLGCPFVDPGNVEVEVKGRKGKIGGVRKVRKTLEAGSASVDTKAAAAFFVVKVNEVLGKGVDIKGQIH